MGICAADDSAQAIGIGEAGRKAGRTDIVVVAVGNSKIGMDAVKAGDIFEPLAKPHRGVCKREVRIQESGFRIAISR